MGDASREQAGAQAEHGEQIVLTTALGPLTIRLYEREAPAASRRFREQWRAGAWAAAAFHRSEAGALVLGPARVAASGLELPEERHAALHFELRGAVAYRRGSPSELVFSCGTGAGGGGAAAAAGPVFAAVTRDCLYVLEAIAGRPRRGDGMLLYPVMLHSHAKPPARPAEPKRRRIRVELKEESDDDELPARAARAPRAVLRADPAPSTAPRDAVLRPSATSSDTALQPGMASQAGPLVSDELRALLAFEQRLSARH